MAISNYIGNHLQHDFEHVEFALDTPLLNCNVCQKYLGNVLVELLAEAVICM